MIVARRAGDVRAASRRWRAAGETIGFVPTMGALHAGHRALLARARRECDRLVASLFVNPLQFGPREDFARYPRPIRRDMALLAEEGTDLLYRPRAETLYPEGFETVVSVSRSSKPLEGVSRPGHFDGVTTVVAKLLAAVEPDLLYLGQKDAQQAIVIARMVRDLDLGVRVVVCPTVRESDGLALSSRNVYLTPRQRAWAPRLYRALKAAASALRSGEIESAGDAEALLRTLLDSGPGTLEYAAVRDARTLGAPRLGGPWLLAAAYRLGSTRLIDNVAVRPAAKGSGRKRRPR